MTCRARCLCGASGNIAQSSKVFQIDGPLLPSIKGVQLIRCIYPETREAGLTAYCISQFYSQLKSQLKKITIYCK